MSNGLKDIISSSVLRQSAKLHESSSPGEQIPINCLVSLPQSYILRVFDEEIVLSSARVTGAVSYELRTIQPEYKVLVAQETGKAVVACAVAEVAGGNLVGITVSTVDTSIKMIQVPVHQRLKSKIHRHKLR